MKKYVLLSLLVLFYNCSQRDNIEENNNNFLAASFNKKSNIISFHTKEEVKKFVENIEENKKEVERFYEEGFVPYRVIDGVSEETFNKLVFEKNKILEKKNNFSKFSIDYEEDTNLIKNDAFASILNAEGELLVGDKIYKYTSNGLYIVDKSDIDYLDKYLKNHKNKPNVGLVKINDKITSYVPNPEDFKKFKVIKNIEEIESNIVQLGYPINTSNYQQCSVTRPFLENIFGRTYVCEYYFNSKRKLRSLFAVEDYYLFFDVYAQSKFKQKTWFGWFSSRDANKVYIKINNANMTFSDRKLKIRVKPKQVMKIFSDIRELLERTSEQKVSYLSNVYTNDNGNINIENYILSEDEILKGGNRRDYIVTPENKKLISNISIDFESLFGKIPKKVFVVTILGKEQSITNQDILKVLAGAYKEFVKKQNSIVENSTGIVVIQKKLDGGEKEDECEIVSYSFGNDIVSVDNLAVAQKKFNIPKKFKIDKLMLNFSLDPSYIKQIDIDMSWKKPDKYEVDIEAGAYYNGQWGGSKYRVVRN